MNEENYTCEICFENYDLKDPNKLPKKVPCCNKTFCLKCLNDIYERNSKVLRCPNCRKITLTPPKYYKDNKLISSRYLICCNCHEKVPQNELYFCQNNNDITIKCEKCENDDMKLNDILPEVITETNKNLKDYENIIKYIHYLNIIHSLQDIKMSMKYEDDIKNILISNINEDDIDKINNNINQKLSELNNNIEDIKKNIENDSVYFEQRLKNLINIEDVKKCISEIQKQYENIISNLFESFLQYNASDKDTENIILLLKIPVNNYNNIIEESMGKIDKIVNYIKNWYDDINKEIGEKVDNAFEAVLNVTNVNLDDDYKNNSKSNFGY